MGLGAEYVRLMLLVGAVRADADVVQLAALRGLEVPERMRAGEDVEVLAGEVRGVMGEGWEPSGDWAVQLEKWS